MSFLGKEIIHFTQIDSTQLEIFRRLKSNTIKNGTIISADIQLSGIGTHGRIWQTDEKNNIAFSFLIEADCNIKKLEGMTTEIAETILEVFEKMYKIKLQIKLPNDIVINNKKIGGILTQTKIYGENVKYIVCGIGINTNKKIFSNNIKDIATSIKKEFGIEIDNKKIIKEFCILFEQKIIKRIGE